MTNNLERVNSDNLVNIYTNLRKVELKGKKLRLDSILSNKKSNLYYRDKIMINLTIPTNIIIIFYEILIIIIRKYNTNYVKKK
jgi:hypothetical protein